MDFKGFFSHKSCCGNRMPSAEALDEAHILRRYLMTTEESEVYAEMWKALRENARRAGVRLPFSKGELGYREGTGYYCVTQDGKTCRIECIEQDEEEFRFRVLKKAAVDAATAFDRKNDDRDAVSWASLEFSGAAMKRIGDDNNAEGKRRRRFCSAFETVLKSLAPVFPGRRIRELTEELTVRINTETEGEEVFFNLDTLKFEPAEK